MTIRAILDGKGDDVIATTPDTSVRDVIRLLAERRIGAVPVVEGGAVVGVFSERDVIHCLKDGDTDTLSLSARDVMTAPAITVGPDDVVLAALSLMTQRRIRHLPVVEQGTLIGIVSIGDLVKYRIDRIEADAEAMRSYIQSA